VSGVKGFSKRVEETGTQERGSEKGDSGWSGRYYYPPRARTQPSRRLNWDWELIPAGPMQRRRRRSAKRAKSHAAPSSTLAALDMQPTAARQQPDSDSDTPPTQTTHEQRARAHQAQPASAPLVGLAAFAPVPRRTAKAASTVRPCPRPRPRPPPSHPKCQPARPLAVWRMTWCWGARVHDAAGRQLA